MTNSTKTEYVVRWAEFEVEEVADKFPTLTSNQDWEDWMDRPVKISTKIDDRTYKSKRCDSEKEARAFADEVIKQYPEDEIKWLAYLEIDRRQTELLSKVK